MVIIGNREHRSWEEFRLSATAKFSALSGEKYEHFETKIAKNLAPPQQYLTLEVFTGIDYNFMSASPN